MKRAEGWYKAGALAKAYGMELVGYELAPDFNIVDGNYRLESKAPEGPFSAPDEHKRFNAAAAPKQRFHYRGLAADYAVQAADNLPQRSQAFAAVICMGLQWAQSNDDRLRVESMYQRYVREGAYVGWGEWFGQSCKDPNFSRASELMWQLRVKTARRALRPYKILITAVVSGSMVGLAFLVLRRRKKDKAAAAGT